MRRNRGRIPKQDFPFCDFRVTSAASAFWPSAFYPPRAFFSASSTTVTASPPMVGTFLS